MCKLMQVVHYSLPIACDCDHLRKCSPCWRTSGLYLYFEQQSQQLCNRTYVYCFWYVLNWKKCHCCVSCNGQTNTDLWGSLSSINVAITHLHYPQAP